MSTKQSTLAKLAARAKAHHESINAAYATYYCGGVSPLPSTTTTPTTSPRSSTSVTRNNSTSSVSSTSSNMNKAWKSLKKAAKEHHESVNAAYATYYGGSAMSSPKQSGEVVERWESGDVEVKGSTVKRVAEQLRKKVVEHHKGVNAAYATYYGGGVTA